MNNKVVNLQIGSPHVALPLALFWNVCDAHAHVSSPNLSEATPPDHSSLTTQLKCTFITHQVYIFKYVLTLYFINIDIPYTDIKIQL